MDALNSIPDSIRPLLTLYAGKTVMAAAIMVGFFIAGSIVKAVAYRVAARDAKRADLFEMLGGAAKSAIVVFGAMSALGTLGIDITAMVAGLGLLGIALGFALKDAVSNFTAGAMLIAYQPFTRGDLIEVAGIRGTVVEIDLRYTRLRGDDADHLVPNQSILGNTVKVTHRDGVPHHSPAE
jgi:small-conductance mechanosensitive channel